MLALLFLIPLSLDEYVVYRTAADTVMRSHAHIYASFSLALTSIAKSPFLKTAISLHMTTITTLIRAI